MNKLNFYTEKTKGGFLGKCRELPTLKYGPKSNRDTALSGAKRLAKKLSAGGFTPPTGPSTVAPATFASSKRKVNRIAFVVDRSGSMRSLTSAAVKALNDNISTIRDQARKTGQTALISVISFDTQIDVIRDNVNVEVFKDVSEYEVSARGSTALFDAVGTAIEKLEGIFIASDEDASFLVLSLTDGEENASTRYGNSRNAQPLVDLMKRVQATDRWTLTFLVPPGASRQLVSMGIPAGNVNEWEATTRGVETYAVQNTQAIGSYFGSRSLGINSTKSFYTDLSKVTTKQIKSQLDDISALVKVLPVEKEVDIKTFVEGKLGRYTPGSAFYQLTKDEKKVQDYKQLLVMEKGKKAVFGGPDARSVLGIPDGDLKIRPGNHGNFDIFVQSTSLNRKLVRGTKLLVKV